MTEIQVECVQRWHREPITNPFDDSDEFEFEKLVCRQHEFNFRLWHEEDLARSPEATDERIATVKRAIDRWNQQRNDAIEQLDDFIADLLAKVAITTGAAAPMNTETPGSAIDRLSIMALRLYHYAEQLERVEADATHMARVAARIEICRSQHADLSNSLQTLIDDLFAGRKRHKTYRQMKMYNDPSLNPAIYGSGNASG
ncbi:DUF4254 domain-containing protein [Neorhodopirellula pilleata]|uniref:DUF4254 domain-containing protein n=1 Tax=Neorhodopirellula pilleata TaxID=2714738 RepID=A0A5C6A169_9BACT|nr:DUF4254 domain-containing protein [Neorhodopirellula pilleata]TWT92293.1 hypothetical protein Pla100_48320 [Neorhodopirellula pilleata]